MQHRSIEGEGRLRVLDGGRPASPRYGEARGAVSGAAAVAKRALSPKVKRRRRLALAVMAVLAAGLVIFVLFNPVMRNMESRRTLSCAEAELEKERAETAELEAREERAKTEEFIEAEARDMGYVKPGEIPLIVIDEEEGTRTPSEPRAP